MAFGWCHAQLLILQKLPHMPGLQSPVLQQALAFQVHRGQFVQIIYIRNSHWCTVTNIGCNEGEVKVPVPFCFHLYHPRNYQPVV